jgi:uncharacterized membrane protein YbhN (UPF0104 family)
VLAKHRELSDIRTRLFAARWTKVAAGLFVLAAGASYLVGTLRDTNPADSLSALIEKLTASPGALIAALACYALAFAVRSWAWCAVLPGLSFGQSWAALHVSLLGNHVLPLRLGEILRVTSVLRRTDLSAKPVTASALTLRAGDLAAVVVLALVAAPTVLSRLSGVWVWPLAGLAIAAATAGIVWSRRLVRGGEKLNRPSPVVVGAVLGAWILESAVVWSIARSGGFGISLAEAVAVTSVTIVVQAVAVTPGGFGSYEAAATAALVAAGLPAGQAFAIALTTHLVKTAYALPVGAVALATPAPAYWGRLRLPVSPRPHPPRGLVSADAPVVAFLPVHNEAGSVGSVIRRLPPLVAGRQIVVIVVDDGSDDASATEASRAGAIVISHRTNRGLGAAVRTGLKEAASRHPAAVVYLDADGEYFPEDIEAIAAPIVHGEADYVVGSRFRGSIDHMLTRRRLGNRVLTAWVRWMTRRPDLTDGQSGYRAFSLEAAEAAEVIHDYNYAQVLTLDLLGKGFRYGEVPIRYTFRNTGKSFIRLGRYLRRVVPAVYRELNPERPAGSNQAAEPNFVATSR